MTKPITITKEMVARAKQIVLENDIYNIEKEAQDTFTNAAFELSQMATPEQIYNKALEFIILYLWAGIEIGREDAND